MTTLRSVIMFFCLLGVLGCASEPVTEPTPTTQTENATSESAKKSEDQKPTEDAEKKPFMPPESARPALGTNSQREPTNAQASATPEQLGGTLAAGQTVVQNNTTGMPTTTLPVMQSNQALAQNISAVSADQALTFLKNGNIRFTNKKLRADGQSLEDIKRVAPQQRPHSAILSCSDSRVPSTLVFDQKLGELIEVRSWGPSLDSGTIASIEYAIEYLGVHLVVVLGQSSCTAVQTLLSLPDTTTTVGSPHLDRVLADLRERLNLGGSQPRTPSANASQINVPARPRDLNRECLNNARGIARDLVMRSEAIRRAVEAGRAQIQVGFYNLDTGSVKFD